MALNLHFRYVCLFLLVATNAQAESPEKVFDITEYGAVTDGQSNSTKPLLNAWKEACEWDGEGRVLIPEGAFLVYQVTLKGPCKGSTVLNAEGLVIAPELKNFTSDFWIAFQNIDNLTVSGNGIFDGQGSLAWPNNTCPINKNCTLLPTSLRFSDVHNATVRDITSLNSKFFHMNIFRSSDFHLENLNITAPGDSPNTDGIHIGDSTRINITRSVIGTGDDCISIGPGNRNISISKIFCGPGHGISVGSLGNYKGETDVVGITVSNCTLTNTTNGLRVKSWPNTPANMTASNFIFDDIIINNVYNPIIIDQHYCPFKKCDPERTLSAVKIKDITFRNITGVSTSQIAVKLNCSSFQPCENLKMSDINLKYHGWGGPAMATCFNAKGTASGTIIPDSCLES